MAKRFVMLIYTPDMVREPVIYTLGQQFNITTNIHRADIGADRGWAVLELIGDEKDIEKGLAWVNSKGVRVEPASHEFTEEQK